MSQISVFARQNPETITNGTLRKAELLGTNDKFELKDSNGQNIQGGSDFRGNYLRQHKGADYPGPFYAHEPFYPIPFSTFPAEARFGKVEGCMEFTNNE